MEKSPLVHFATPLVSNTTHLSVKLLMMPAQKTTRRRLLAAPLLLLLPTACQTYQLGLPEGPPFQSVHVAVVKNDTYAPQMQGHMTRAVREAFATGGSPVRLGNEGVADATLEITLDKYFRKGATFNPRDTGEPASFNLNLSAKATLVDNRTGDVYFKDRPFRQTIQSFGTDQLPERERQNLPLLARNLASNIYEDVTTVW